MKYMVFNVYNADHSDEHFYLFNKSIHQIRSVNSIVARCKKFIANDLKAKGKNLKDYKADRKAISFQEYNKSEKRYTIIDFDKIIIDIDTHHEDFYKNAKEQIWGI